ncbi:MAG: hypothetical protein ACQCN3_09885 [Candidatus Bathyarchaeia archaeon]
MKKTTSFIAAVVFAVLVLAEFPFEAAANPTVYASMPKFEIQSPKNGTIESGNVKFEVTGQVMERYYVNKSEAHFYCYLDNQEFTVNATYVGNTSDGWLIFKGETTLNLQEGNYTLKVWQISCSQIARMLNPVIAEINVSNKPQIVNSIFETILCIVASISAIVMVAAFIHYKKIKEKN